MHASTRPLQPGSDAPESAPADSERIAALERQVADLAAVIRELTATVPALEMAFAAGRECERGALAPRPAGRLRPRHLCLAAGGES
jgi:hypothetical protein